MKVADEVRHLADGPRQNELPDDELLVRVWLRSEAPVHAVVAKCKQVLDTVVQIDGDSWPSEALWAKILPVWFVEGCAPEESAEQKQQWLDWWRTLNDQDRSVAAQDREWSLAAWLHWFQPAERQWYWWDGEPVDETHGLITVATQGLPVPLGALRWLLRVAGADEIVVDD
jgi:hypothetical protein